MTGEDAQELTTLLARLNAGDEAAMGRLMETVHAELRAIARRHLDRLYGDEHAGATLQPTALVNETYLKLIRQRQKYDNRGQFFAIATKLMIRVLLDHHRRRRAGRRGGGWIRVPLDGVDLPDDGDGGTDIAALVAAMEKLEALDARKADVVKLRVLWGLSNEEVAQSLSVGRATVDRDWAFAKAWLRNELAGTES